MGGRYWITGVQLGILTRGTINDRIKIMQEIIDNQFIGNIGDKSIEMELFEKMKEES